MEAGWRTEVDEVPRAENQGDWSPDRYRDRTIWLSSGCGLIASSAIAGAATPIDSASAGKKFLI